MEIDSVPCAVLLSLYVFNIYINFRKDIKALQRIYKALSKVLLVFRSIYSSMLMLTLQLKKKWPCTLSKTNPHNWTFSSARTFIISVFLFGQRPPRRLRIARHAGKSVSFWLKSLLYPSIHLRSVCLTLIRLAKSGLCGTEKENASFSPLSHPPSRKETESSTAFPCRTSFLPTERGLHRLLH